MCRVPECPGFLGVDRTGTLHLQIHSIWTTGAERQQTDPAQYAYKVGYLVIFQMKLTCQLNLV